MKFAVRIVGLLITAFFAVSTLTWIDKLERIGCACSKGWRRTVIKAFAIFAIIYGSLNFGLAMQETSLVHYIGPMAFLAFILLLIPFYVTFMVVSISYPLELKREKCECSEDYRRTVVWAWGIYIASAFGLSIIMGMVVGLPAVRTLKK
jgi:hypothetical protein